MIEIKNLKKVYENFEIDIDLSIKEGEIFGIIGQSASGKTSTLELISDRLSDEYNIATIFQDFNLLNNLSVFENIALPLRINNNFDEKKVLDALDFVSLVEKKHDYPSQLSGGQRQRVAIARALLQNPDILLCDEITSSLDKKIAKDICDLFKKLDCTIIFVTHELDIAKYICDRVAIIEQGRVKDIIKVNKQDIFVQDYYNYAKEFLND